MVNAEAITTLPAPLRALFEGNAAYLAEHSIDPDLWRSSGRAGEDPNHYLDLDAFGPYPFDSIPRVEAGHLAKHGKDAAERGRVPWRVAEVYRDLVAAFRANDAARILEHAAVLGHYVGDAHVPLHAVLNYDGQLTGQTGIHARWEAELFERFERQFEARALPSAARRVEDPVGFVFGALLESHARSRAVLASDESSAGKKDYADTAYDDRYDDAYYSRLFEREGQGLAERLGASATAVGSLWLSAWEEAGRPTLDAAFRFPYVRRQSRVLLVSLDGSGALLVDDALARGFMPNLARLRAAGATATGSLTSLPVKTAASHASVYTGTWPDRHGIAGNELPKPGGNVLTSVNGYRSDALRAEPIWVTAARQGLEVTTLLATQTYPFSPYLEEKRFGGSWGRNLTLIDGYNPLSLDDALYAARDLALRPAAGWIGEPAPSPADREFDLDVAGTRVDGLLLDDPADPTAGFDTLLLSVGRSLKRAERLKPRPAAETGVDDFQALLVPTRDGEVGAFFRLFALAPDASEILLYRAEAGLIASNRGLVGPAATRASGGFIGNGGSHRYREGAFGPPLWAGGDGTAEKRYLETARLVTRQIGRLTEFAVNRTRWDLLIAYLPYPDEALHLWLGFLDPALPGHDPKVAERARAALDRALTMADGYLGELMRLAGTETVVAVMADHGLVPVNRRVRLNVALEKAGLLVLDGSGRVDLSRSQAVYAPWSSGYFLINRVSRPGGVVPPEEENGVRARLVAALHGLRDPETNAPVVTETFDPRKQGPEPGLGGIQGGDLYFNLARGYFPSPDLTGDLVSAMRPSGEHLLDPRRREMLAIFALAGPGIAQGIDLGLVRQIDVAPTLCALLGIEPPAQAAGRVLGRALARLPAAQRE